MPVLRSHVILPLLMALVCALPVGAQQSAPFRSATHPYEVPPARSSNLSDRPVRLFGSDLALAVTNGDTAWYTSGVNHILCSLTVADQTWLGTAFGMKRLDAKTHTTQHYTTLDGLPYPLITALATDGGTMYCASVRKREQAKSGAGQGGIQEWRARPDDAVALCVLDAKTGQWRVMAEVKPEEMPTPNAALDPSAMSETEFVPRQWITHNNASVCLVPGPCIPGKTVALLAAPEPASTASAPTRPIPTAEAPERIMAPEFIKQPLVITTAQMDAQSLWLGTRQGLLRYDLQTRRWETLLQDAAVFGGDRAADGSLWILTRTAVPNEKDMEQGTSRLVHWQAVHLTPAQTPTAAHTNPSFVISYLVRERRESPNEWTQGWLENITLADNKVWMTVNQRLGWGHAQMAYPPQVFSLDPQTRSVKVEASFPGNSSDDYLHVPLTVLANSHTGWGLLMPLVMPSRFPGWECAADPHEAALLEPPREQPEPRDAEGRLWTFVSTGGGKRNGKFLHRESIGDRITDADADYHAPPPVNFSVHDEAKFPVALGGRVYFLSGTYTPRLYAWDRKTERVAAVAWAEAVLQKHHGERLDDYKMLAGTDCVWISTGSAVLRCEVNAQRVEVWQDGARGTQSVMPRYALVGVEGDTAWVKSDSNHLYTASAARRPYFAPVSLPPFPPDLERVRDTMQLFALEDHIAWFVDESGQSSVALNGRPLIGWNLQTRQWTKPTMAALPYVNAGDTLTVWRQGRTCWFPTYTNEASAVGYDAAREQWTALPRMDTPRTTARLRLAGVDAQNAWLTDSGALYHLDRASGKWDIQDLPFQQSLLGGEGSARSGECLYLASSTGVWACDTGTKRITQSPGVDLPPYQMNYDVMSVDAKAVWLTVSKSDTYFVCRFDRTKETWTYWSRADGLPPHPGLLTGDGRSCWLRADGLLYHLDPQTNRWDNVSRRLAAGQNDGKENGRDSSRVVPIQQVLADGADVWLVSGASRQTYRQTASLPLDTVVAAASPLYRYHADTRQITAVDPAQGKTLTPARLWVSAQSLLLAAPQGVYRLDRASGKWQAITLPPAPAGWPVCQPYAAREVADKDGATLWTLCSEEGGHGISNAVRFRRVAGR